MTGRPRHPVLWFLGAAVTAATLSAHVRLLYPTTGAALYWSNPSNVTLVLQSDGSDDINDGSEATALRSAMAAWNGVTGANLQLVENAASGQRARRDWASTDIHLVLFDEDNDSGYFPGSSGIVALTPITFYTNGRIIDADVLFNGKNFGFTTRGQVGRFDIQDVATHELGHLVGLDHSGCAGATMYPYVDTSVILHRSLSLDDIRGVRHMYPSASYGQIMGTLLHEGTSNVVAGAHVVALDMQGRLAGATLSNSSGNFALQALDTGRYTVYADALDFPVSVSNLGGGQTVDTSFGSTVLGTIDVVAGSTATLGSVEVLPDVAVSLGRIADDYPLRAISGQTVARLVRGAELVSGSTLTASDPSITVTPTAWFGTSVQFDVTVQSGAALGHADLIVTSPSGDVDILTAALEITPPNPEVLSVTPADGEPVGGTFVTVTGTNFRPGLRVVIGDRIYVEGAPGGATLVDPTTLTLTTAATIGGEHDVVVIDPSGVEGRAVDSFTVLAAPAIATLFPSVGSAAGGTEVILTGSNFVTGALVTIDGIAQPNVRVDSPTQMTIFTAPGVVGGPYIVEVTNPGGASATAAFAYVGKADPVLTYVTPDRGSPEGGQTITLMGTGFSAETQVVFGAHPKTGVGGTAAASVELESSTTLRVRTPASSSTVASVLVRDAETGQASILASGFQYEHEPEIPSLDKFGACGAVDPAHLGPPTARKVFAGAGWILVALAAAALQRRAALRRSAYPAAV